MAQLHTAVMHATSTWITSDQDDTPYKGTATLTVGLIDSRGYGLANQPLVIERSYNDRSWGRLARIRTASVGYTSLKVAPVRKTYYRVRFLGAAGLSASTSQGSPVVAPRVFLGRPSAPTTMTCNTIYTVTGALKPQQRPGKHLVLILAYHYEGGKWRLTQTVSTEASNYSSYSKYRGRIALATPGTWRLFAFVPRGSWYARTLSQPKSVAVPTE